MTRSSGSVPALPQVNTLNTLDAVGLTDKTVIVRTADHGEMGLSHGTLIQKNFNMWVARLAPALCAPAVVLCCWQQRGAGSCNTCVWPCIR
jgi:hypothetical protein